MNLYAYVLNNPLRYTDPDGLMAREAYDWTMDTALPVVSDVSAGFGDTITFGATKTVRDMWNETFWDGQDSVNYDSGAYKLGTGKTTLDAVTNLGAPDVRFGLDSPIGGMTTTLPFGSGGNPTTSRTTPSINTPLAPGVNMKIDGKTNVDTKNIGLRTSISTPLGGGKLNTDISSMQMNFNLRGPQMNFPLGYGANAYIGIQW